MAVSTLSVIIMLNIRTDTIEELTDNSDLVLESLNLLLPQLSENAKLLTKDDLSAILKSLSSHLFVAYKNNMIVGMLTLTINVIPTGKKVMIEDVVVDKNFRKYGIAKELVTFGLNYAKQNGAKSVELTSRPSREAANKLYSKLGFNIRDTNVYRFNFD